MEEFIVQQYFTDVKRCKYIYESSGRRKHSFLGVDAILANIVNRCAIELASLTVERTEYLILSVTWVKPHYFIINTKTYNILWAKGIVSSAISFKKKDATICSLSSFIQNLSFLAEEGVLVDWAKCEKFIKPTSAKKKLEKMRSKKRNL